MLKRQSTENSFSFGLETQAEFDLEFARKTLAVLCGLDKTAQETGKNKLPEPQEFSPVQVEIFKVAVALAGRDNIVTSPLKQGKFDMSRGRFVRTGPDIPANFETPSELFSLDEQFSPIEDFIRVFDSLSKGDI